MNKPIEAARPLERGLPDPTSAVQSAAPRRLRVGVAFPGCHHRGGVERIVWESARFLAGRGHHVHVYANEWEPEMEGAQASGEFALAGGELRFEHVAMRARPGFLAGRSFFERCTRVLQEHRAHGPRIDVLNTHGCVCPLGGVYRVHSVQRAWLERSRAMRSALSASRIKQRLNPLHPVLLALEEKHFRERGYARLIALTPHVKSDLERLYDVPGQDIDVIPNGFAPEEFNAARRLARRASARADLGLREDDVALLFVANELERKGFPVLLRALAQMGQPRLKVLVVGKPPRDEVEAMSQAAGVASQIIAVGPTRDVGLYHAAADAFVLPTQYEAFCLAILEALGSGLPVVTTQVPGANDAIVPGHNGFAIADPLSADELAHALAQLLNEDERARLSANAPDSVSQYQWPAIMLRYEKVLLDHARS